MNAADWILKHGENLQIAGFFSILAVLVVAERLAPRRTGAMSRTRR